jgi:predicted metal-dependent hydrolase
MRSGRASWGAPWDAPPALSREQETEALKAQAEWLQEQLAAVKERIEALEKE